MEVVISSSPLAMDFDRPAPFLSTPPSPSRFANLCFSAPTSPTRMSEFYRNFHEDLDGLSLDDERNPSPIPKSSTARSEDEFAFDFKGDLERESVSADEIFDGGKIRPLKPPPRFQLGQNDEKISMKNSSPRSPRSPIARGKRIIKDTFLPKKKNDVGPFAAAVESTLNRAEQERGRDRVSAFTSSASSSRRAARSLSPCTVAERQWEEELHKKNITNQSLHNSSKSSTTSSLSSSSSSSKRNRKWRLRDFLLFRSASEGDKDSLKYTALFKKSEDVKQGSFRSTQRSGSGGSGSRRKGQVSAHELHYTANRAVSEDMKKKTFLPYKKNIFVFGPFSRK